MTLFLTTGVTVTNGGGALGCGAATVGLSSQPVKKNEIIRMIIME